MKSFIIWFCSSLGLGLFITMLTTGPAVEASNFFWVLGVTTLFWMGMLTGLLADEN